MSVTVVWIYLQIAKLFTYLVLKQQPDNKSSKSSDDIETNLQNRKRNSKAKGEEIHQSDTDAG